ncbi:unnamed protein product [Somion occarium]|uniref:UBC core domain-containing protein n=1 Tax=Somion occarium TaxID=3059160 RepID=A0ABP1CG18_9APHY
MTRKRRLSDCTGPEKAAKRVHQAADEEEEPLDSILARIQEQEQSEQLARQLHQQWNDSSNGEGSGSSRRDVISVDDSYESDEALARRLASEWNEQDDDIIVLDVPTASPSSLQDQVKSGSSIGITSASPSGRASQGPPEDAVDSADVELEQHREVFVRIRQCTKCGKDVESPRGHVTYSPQVPPPSLLFLLHAVCTSCKTNHCRGCFSAISCSPSCKGKGKEKDSHCPAITCCAEIRAVALFEALGGFDRLYLGEQATAEARAKEATAKRKKSSGTVGPGGTGYSMGSRGYNYDSGRKGRGKSSSSLTSRNNTDALAAHWDELLVRALSTVTFFLPSPYSDSEKEYDILPHPSIAALISLSQLPDLLGRLLRNDSVTDWIARSDLYQSMLALLRRMADYELTLQALVNTRFEMKKSCGLEEWMWQDGDIVWERSDGRLIKTPPLYSHFQKLTKQSETFLTGASRMLEDGDHAEGEDTETMVKATSLCGDIITARDGIERAMKVMGKDPSTLHNEQRKYAKACEHLAFKYVSLPNSPSFPGFHYARELQQTANATRNPKNRLHLIKELAVMATSLPTGIWVRPHEVRNDAIKVMIAGPEGTPYAGGLFEFDCFIPLEYPHSPPKMNLCTTGGGRVRFNPNLYNCGKVCLSLLGTWAGRPEEMWSPKSTLLQVLVSIQSMILIELPFFNEPGFGQANASDPRSIAYNKDITFHTTRWAIVEWLKDEHGNGMWADVIASHFTIWHSKIRKCIEGWAKSEPRIRNCAASTAAPNIYAGGPMYPLPQYPKLQTSPSLDLLTEYDQGIERIRQWKLED